MLLMLAVSVLVVVVDQFAKSMIVSRLQEGAFTSANIFGVRLCHVVNRRKPWSSVNAVRLMAIVWVLVGATALMVASAIGNSYIYAALGALMGGMTGNLLDGLSRHAVTDFIDLRVWPVFNVADTAIVAGAALLLWRVVQQ